MHQRFFFGIEDSKYISAQLWDTITTNGIESVTEVVA